MSQSGISKETFNQKSSSMGQESPFLPYPISIRGNTLTVHHNHYVETTLFQNFVPNELQCAVTILFLKSEHYLYMKDFWEFKACNNLCVC